MRAPPDAVNTINGACCSTANRAAATIESPRFNARLDPARGAIASLIDKRTGRLVARDDEHIAPNIFHSTWSSPSLATVNGRPLVFFNGGNGIVYAFETVRNGVMEYRSDGVMDDNKSAQHSTAPPLQFPAFLRKVWQFDFDPGAPKTNVHRYNSNRRESPSNFYGMPVFDHNRLYIAGGGDIWWGKNEAWLKCIDATRTGDITTNGLIWTYTLQKHVLSTPAVYNGMVFVADCGRLIHCVDAETGQPLWTHEINGDAWASPMVADGKVYLGTRGGTARPARSARRGAGRKKSSARSTWAIPSVRPPPPPTGFSMWRR